MNNLKKTTRSERYLYLGLVSIILVTIIFYSCDNPTESNPPYVGNRSPVITRLDKSTGNSIFVGDTATITCFAEDQDGDFLTYEWTIAAWYEQFAGFKNYFGNSVKFFADSAVYQDGQYRAIPFKVDVYDPWRDQATRWDSIVVLPRVQVNSPPRILALIAELDTVAPLDTIQIFAVIRDDDDPIASLDFEWGYTGGYNLASSQQRMTWKAPHDQLSYKITYTVSDQQSEATEHVYVVVKTQN